jgi:hypothetical protein
MNLNRKTYSITKIFIIKHYKFNPKLCYFLSKETKINFRIVSRFLVFGRNIINLI